MNWTLRIVFGIIAALVTLLVLIVWISARSMHQGIEFSPDDFTCRKFSYVKEPSTGYVLVGRTFDSSYIDLPNLVNDGFISKAYHSPKTWLLISHNSSYLNSELSYPVETDARLLIDYLRLTTDRDENVWSVWNTDRPKIAKVFWPAIAEMARDQAFLTIGDVLDFALDTTAVDKDVDGFKEQLNRIVSEAYYKLADIKFLNDDLVRADVMIGKSIKYHSTDKAVDLKNQISTNLDEPSSD